MKTFKLEFKLPTVDEIPRGLKPLTVKAEQAVAEADRTLEKRRKDLADLERLIRELPDRARRGEVAAKALADALVKRDTAKMRVQGAFAELTQAKERATAELKTATTAVDLEFGRRAKQLEDVIDLINPVLIELRELAIALGVARHGGGALALDWVESPNASMRMR